MEYLEGITLKQYLQTYGPISVEEMQNIFAPILEALDKIHQNGVIHRDISPDNIMCLPEGEVKLMDFGAARDYTDYSAEGLSVILRAVYAETVSGTVDGHLCTGSDNVPMPYRKKAG